MNLRIPALLLVVCMSINLFSLSAYAQNKTLNGVFAGIEVSLPTVMGQGMSRTDRVVLFRPDGTFNEKMRSADWKTAVTGRYTIAGNKVKLQYNGGSKEEMDLEADGDLKAWGSTGSYGMLKMATYNSVPAGLYKFSNVSSTGGGASGQIFTGSSSNIALYLDGKGGFSRNANSATMVSGGNVGGGVSNKNDASGTYTIKEGVLVLSANGKTETHSFFCRPGEKPLMAAIDGRIFFVEEEKASAKNNKPATTIANNKPVAKAGKESGAGTSTGTAPAAGAATDAHAVLLNANKVQGSAVLDGLKTFKVAATMNGMNIVSLADIANGKVRIEYRRGTQLAGIEQLEGEQGWQWQNGKKTALSEARKTEMKNGLYAGVLGLRTRVIGEMKNLVIKQVAKDGVAVTGTINGVEHIFIFNEKGELTGDAFQSSASVYSNFKKVDGLLLPFTEKNRSNGQIVQITYNSYVVNPVFSEADWALQ